MLTPEELHRRGVVAMNAGRLSVAKRLMAQALDRTDDAALRARIEASLAYVETDTSDLATGLRLCERALAFPGLSPEIRGVLLCQKAVILRRSGQALRALDSFSEAIDSLRDLPADLGKAYLNRGTVHMDRGELTAASRDFESAASSYQLAGDHIAKAKAEHNRGYVLFLAGDLVGALHAMETAHEVLGPVGPVVNAVCEQDRAEVLLAAGLLDAGVEMLRGAARDYGRRRMRQRQAEAELTLSTSLLTYNPLVARASARKARRRFASLGADAWRARADAEVLAADVELGGSSPVLLGAADHLHRELSAQGLRWRSETVLLHAARVQIRRGDLDAAKGVLSDVRAGARAPLAVRLLDRDVRAELAAAGGRSGRALQHLRAGLADLHAWQSSFGSLDLQTNVMGHGKRLGVRALTLAVDSRDPSVLFEWSERGRMLASRVQPVRAPQDESIVADLAELREMAQAREGDRPIEPEREAELRQQVRQRAWRHRGSGEVDDPVSLGELQDGLGRDRALVAYVVTGNRVVALVVTGADTAQLDLGERVPLDELLDGLRPDLDMAASELPDSLAGVVRRQLGDRLGRLAELLVTPVLDAVGDRQVVLTPSGVMAAVPWTLLPGFVGRPVTVAQSATSWLSRRDSPLRAGSAGLVAGPRVDRAEDEVLAVAREWNQVEVLTGEQSTAESVSRLAAGVDVLHVAAHGRHSAENPMFSGLELIDGPWYGYDIDQLRAVPDVVLLSACEVGASTVRWGEELIGMAGAWLHAGSRRVVASAAAINDRAAFAALVRVHERLAAGDDPAVALALAVPAVSADAPPVPLVCFA